jgi:hypothetical protein
MSPWIIVFNGTKYLLPKDIPVSYFQVLVGRVKRRSDEGYFYSVGKGRCLFDSSIFVLHTAD